MSGCMDWDSKTHAIVVAGHAVYTGGCGPDRTPEQTQLDEHWSLQPFQKGEAPFYTDHIRHGVMLTAADPSALLIFSGGQTRAPLVLSEAQSYHNLASVFQFWEQEEVRRRVTTEEFSRDSVDNLIFSIARFQEAVGKAPLHVTVVSWKFKSARFRHHAWSIRWPATRFSFAGVGVPVKADEAERAEAKTLVKFQDDVLGTDEREGGLGLKKKERNPYRRQHGYARSCPDLAGLLLWRGKKRVPAVKVPW